jgi:diaminopimelate decarboxylase
MLLGSMEGALDKAGSYATLGSAYYAVKANNDPAIVKTIYDAGASFDVASVAEERLLPVAKSKGHW